MICGSSVGGGAGKILCNQILYSQNLDNQVLVDIKNNIPLFGREEAFHLGLA